MSRNRLIAYGSFLFLAAIVALSVLSFVRQSSTSWWVQHTHDVSSNLGACDNALLEMEGARRAYLLSGNKRFIVISNEARSRVCGFVKKLIWLTQDNSDQLKRLTLLESQLNTLFAASNELINARGTGDYDRHLVENMLVLQGHTARVRQTIAEASQEESRLLEVRRKPIIGGNLSQTP